VSAVEPGTPAEPSSPGGSAGVRPPLWRSLLPHLFTAVAAVATSLLLQLVFASQRPVAPPTPTLTLPTPRPTLPPSPTSVPQPSSPPLSSGITSQELADLRAEDDEIWTAIYLSRAISQIAEAESAMRANDLAAVDQTLIAVDDSLALAAARAADAQRDPIDQLRRDASAMREDLYLRPEGMDARLARLRQTILALIEERGAG
jgi:hypothetical protein